MYAAYAEAMKSTGQPTVILAKTVKGYGLSDEIEAVNKTHQIKKMQIESLKKENERLSDLRDCMLPRLMSGELDVSDLDVNLAR